MPVHGNMNGYSIFDGNVQNPSALSHWMNRLINFFIVLVL